MRDDYDHDTKRRDRHSQQDRRDGDEPRAFFGAERNDRPPWERSRRRDPYGERDPKYGSDAYHEGPPREETERLIASNKVEGTPVYDRNGEKLGTIHNFMVDKFDGRVIYAVMKSAGGFLGLGERYYPLDWCDLTYDTRAHGYGVEFSEDDLDRRRSFDASGREIIDRHHGRPGFREHPRDRW